MRLLLARIQRLANFFGPPTLAYSVWYSWFGISAYICHSRLSKRSGRALTSFSQIPGTPVLGEFRASNLLRIWVLNLSGTHRVSSLFRTFLSRSHHALRTTRKSYPWIFVHLSSILTVFIMSICYKYYITISFMASWSKDTIINLSACFCDHRFVVRPGCKLGIFRCVS